jgi:hypothetical protein
MTTATVSGAACSKISPSVPTVCRSTSPFASSRVAQSAQCLTTDWVDGVRSPITSASRPALGPTQPPIQWVPGALSPGVKRGRGVMLTTHRLPVPRSRKNSSYTSCHPNASLWSVTGPLYLFTSPFTPCLEELFFFERRWRK